MARQCKIRMKQGYLVIYSTFRAAQERELWAAIVGAAVDTNAHELPEPESKLASYHLSFTSRLFTTFFCIVRSIIYQFFPGLFPCFMPSSSYLLPFLRVGQGRGLHPAWKPTTVWVQCTTPNKPERHMCLSVWGFSKRHESGKAQLPHTDKTQMLYLSCSSHCGCDLA